jgi:hypothetical protein
MEDANFQVFFVRRSRNVKGETRNSKIENGPMSQRPDGSITNHQSQIENDPKAR